MDLMDTLMELLMQITENSNNSAVKSGCLEILFNLDNCNQKLKKIKDAFLHKSDAFLHKSDAFLHNAGK